MVRSGALKKLRVTHKWRRRRYVQLELLIRYFFCERRARPATDIDDDALGTFELFFIRGPRALFHCARSLHPVDLLLMVLRGKTDMLQSRSAVPIRRQRKYGDVY